MHAACVQLPKSEIRSTKSESNPKSENKNVRNASAKRQKLKTQAFHDPPQADSGVRLWRTAACFGLGISVIEICFEFRISCFGFLTSEFDDEYDDDLPSRR